MTTTRKEKIAATMRKKWQTKEYRDKVLRAQEKAGLRNYKK